MKLEQFLEEMINDKLLKEIKKIERICPSEPESSYYIYGIRENGYHILYGVCFDEELNQWVANWDGEWSDDSESSSSG